MGKWMGGERMRSPRGGGDEVKANFVCGGGVKIRRGEERCLILSGGGDGCPILPGGGDGYLILPGGGDGFLILPGGVDGCLALPLTGDGHLVLRRFVCVGPPTSL